MTVELWNGDSRELAHKIQGPINAIITDPPYGMAFKSNKPTTPKGKRWVAEIESDGDLETALALFWEVMEILVPKTADECELYVFTRWDILGPWLNLIRELPGFKPTNGIVWDKGNPGLGDLKGSWGNNWELAIYAKKGRRELPRRASSVIHVDKLPPTQHIHPTEKPVQLLERLIDMSTSPGDLIVDPFAGSASCLKAAQNLGRNAIGIEKDSRYIALAQARLDQMTLL